MQDNLYFCIMLDCKHHIKMKPFVRRLLGAAVSVAVLYSCASVGRLEGGPIDEEPPRFVTGSPLPGALHNKKSKISIEFDEFIKLEKANEKVVISPPQVQQPEIKANGKRVVVNLQDTLKANTTYTIDFADAIQDNNEGNPMQGFTYTFSTGAELDSMAIAGTLLDASNLEPVKGVLVGLHANLADSAFTTLPFDRVGRTDSRGQFSIRGVSPGKYRIYALMDADQNFKFSQPTEVIAFNDSVIIPSMERRMRQDTLWRDSLTVDTIVERQYTHFLPDDVLLRSFKEKTFSQRLMKTERLTPEKFSFYFTAPADSLPLMKGLNFDEKDAFVIEQTTGRNDTIHYWIKDSLLYQQDTLRMSLSYLYTDTLNQLVPRTDTLRIVSKVSWQKLQEKKLEAENLIREAKKAITDTLKVQEKEILFTSGGTESNNTALIGTALANRRAGKHLITTGVEHPSIYNTMSFLEEMGFEVTYLPVDHLGHISLEDLEKAIREDTILVSVMYVNNEVGAVEPIEAISQCIKKKNPKTLFHVDAIQAYGKYKIRPKKQVSAIVCQLYKRTEK